MKTRKVIKWCFKCPKCSVRFFVYKWPSSLFTGIVFKLQMHVHNFNLHLKGPSITFQINFRNMLISCKEMVETMSIASLFHHQGCGNKSLCNSLFAFMFPFSNTCSHSRYFHWNGSEIPQYDRKVIEGPCNRSHAY